MEPEIIFEDWSPVCDIQAFVEKNNRAYYFYLWINPESKDPEIRSCWICNRAPSADMFDAVVMKKGEAPAMPKEYVDHDHNGIELAAESLSVHWFEESDGAALMSDDKIIALIPGYSKHENFHGYSIYAKGKGPYAWGLLPVYEKYEKVISEADGFWSYFETDYWAAVQDKHIRALNEFMGKYEAYYAIDGDHFPPKALIQGRKDSVIYGITCGVSLIPMPKVEMRYGHDYKEHRRMELGFACKVEHEDYMNKMLGVISGIADIPWRKLTFIDHGTLLPFNGIEGYEYILFLNARSNDKIPMPDYKLCMGNTLNLIWIKLITPEDYKILSEKGLDDFLADPEHISIIN